MRETGHGRFDLRGGAEYSKGGEAAFVRKEEVKRGETGLDGQNIEGGAGEAVGGPPLDLVPEDGELP